MTILVFFLFPKSFPLGLSCFRAFTACHCLYFSGYTLMHPSLTRPYLLSEPPLHTDIIHYENIPKFELVRQNILRYGIRDARLNISSPLGTRSSFRGAFREHYKCRTVLFFFCCLFFCFFVFGLFLCFPSPLPRGHHQLRASALKTTSHLLVTEGMRGMRPRGPGVPPSTAGTRRGGKARCPHPGNSLWPAGAWWGSEGGVAGACTPGHFIPVAFCYPKKHLLVVLAAV